MSMTPLDLGNALSTERVEASLRHAHQLRAEAVHTFLDRLFHGQAVTTAAAGRKVAPGH